MNLLSSLKTSLGNAPRIRAEQILSVLAPFILLAGCAAGPDYKRPQVVVPPNWKLAEPSDQTVKSDWWTLFQDPILNQLEEQGTKANPQVQSALAHIDQSRAVARISASHFFPQTSFDPSAVRFRTQADHIPSQLESANYTLPLDFSYEIDLWGKIRRSFESAQAQAQATVADYYNVLLTLHGDIAVNYFLLRQLDVQLALLDDTVKLRENSVRIVAERFHVGLAPELDLDRARTDLAQTQTLRTETQRQRDNIQNALALLCGQPAADFQIQPGTLNQYLPAIPVGLPSQLLERRPDIAEAERKMAAANAQIGVAKAAFFPAVTLTGEAGYSSFHVTDLFAWQSRMYQVGPAVTAPILNGGRLKSGLKEARANYEATCASYQQQVLVAFRDVSDSLVNLNNYKQQSISESEATTSADHAAGLAKERYVHGLINYLDVLEAERTQLETQIRIAQIHALQLVATVHLVKALGGGFDERTIGLKASQGAAAQIKPSSGS
jgi:multidrug efflux system outer membrane protein